MSVPQGDGRVLILAPTGRDADLARAALGEAGLPACICRDAEALLRELAVSAGAALITNEALTPPVLDRLTETLAAQPPWSDLPLVILTAGGPASGAARRLEVLESLGNATLLERPLRVPTLISVIRVALAARRRQYELREHLAERERLEQTLQAEYEKQRHIAETLQRSLLTVPAPDAFPGLSVVPLYQAARDEADIGGDFFDAFALNGERVALVVGDVSGKGLAAASRTSEVKYALRAFLREDASPAGALDRVNDFLLDTQTLDGQSLSSFVCVALGVLELETGALQVSSAGSEAPLILRAGGDAEVLSGNGPPLGVTAMAEYAERPVRLGAGDTLLFVTDGVTEARRGRDFFGHEGFVEAARRAPASLDALGEAIIREATDFAGGRLDDDVCLLLARFGPRV